MNTRTPATVLTIPRLQSRLYGFYLEWNRFVDATPFKGFDYHDLGTSMGREGDRILPIAAILGGHLAMWKSLLTTDRDWWLIIEDDARPGPDFTLAPLLESPPGWEVIKFHWDPAQLPVADHIHVTTDLVRLPPQVWSSTECYAITRPAVERCLDRFSVMSTGRLLATHCQCLGVVPMSVYFDSDRSYPEFQSQLPTGYRNREKSSAAQADASSRVSSP